MKAWRSLHKIFQEELPTGMMDESHRHTSEGTCAEQGKDYSPEMGAFSRKSQEEVAGKILKRVDYGFPFINNIFQAALETSL